MYVSNRRQGDRCLILLHGYEPELPRQATGSPSSATPTGCEGRASVEAMVCGAAMLSNATVGYASSSRRVRYGADGKSLHSFQPDLSATVVRRSRDIGEVWLERVDGERANNALLVERLGLALDIIESRNDDQRGNSVRVLLDPASPPSHEDTLEAARRLRINSIDGHGAVAQLLSDPRMADAPSSLIVTPWGG